MIPALNILPYMIHPGQFIFLTVSKAAGIPARTGAFDGPYRWSEKLPQS
ncbi:MAG TPA: hypothetical protein VMG30_05575 [Acidobacteriota bacterium]|nr:hypothetical protein [Acidobacteriota bacterium]